MRNARPLLGSDLEQQPSTFASQAGQDQIHTGASSGAHFSLFSSATFSPTRHVMTVSSRVQ